MNNLIKRVWTRKELVFVEDLRGMAFTQEDGAHTFSIAGKDENGVNLALSGTVAGSLIRPDGTTTAMTGTIADGCANLTLSPECYGVSGRASLTIFLTSGGQKTAIYHAVMNIGKSSTSQVSPGVAADVVDLVNRIDTATASIPATYTALLGSIASDYDPSKTYKTGEHVWYGGYLYKAKQNIDTAESWTSGHWTKVVLADDFRSDITSLKRANSYFSSDTNHTIGIKTTAEGSAQRFFFMYPFIAGRQYRILLKVNAMPGRNGNNAQLAINSSSSINTQSISEVIVPDLKDLTNGSLLEYIFKPKNDTLYFYAYVNPQAGDVDVDVTISSFPSINSEYPQFRRIAAIKRNVDSEQRVFFPYSMKSGKTYKLNIYVDLKNAIISTSDLTICAVSAVNLQGSGASFSTHDSIIRFKSRAQSNSNFIGFNVWEKIDYTAANDTEYIELFLNRCDSESCIAVDAEDGQNELPNYIYTSGFSIANHDERMIYDNKPYPFKRIGSYSGSGQSIIEKNGDIFVFTNGTMYRFHDFSIISTSTLFAHPINASIMRNGNILISDITGYKTPEEIRHIYEYDPDNDTIVNDYSPTVEGKHLVLSEQISETTLLAAYKNDEETTRIIYWYSYDIENDTLVYISETVHDRVYTQGCSLRGGLVYVMTNNISTSKSNPAKLIVVELSSGQIKNEIVLPGFGETEGFYISYTESPGTYAYMLDNGDNYIYLIKLV